MGQNIVNVNGHSGLNVSSVVEIIPSCQAESRGPGSKELDSEVESGENAWIDIAQEVELEGSRGFCDECVQSFDRGAVLKWLTEYCQMFKLPQKCISTKSLLSPLCSNR